MNKSNISSPLPKGNWALAIAHPGHELRLHGFLEQARPFTFILTDGSEKTGADMMHYSIRCIDKAIKQGMRITPMALKDDSLKRIFNVTVPMPGEDKHVHLKDQWIYHYVTTLNPDFLLVHLDMMVKKMIQWKVDYLVCDASEDFHLSHEVVRMLSELAIIKVQTLTQKQIKLFEFPVNKPWVQRSDDKPGYSMELSDELLDRKLDAIINYPNAIDDLKPFINCDMNVIKQIGEMKDGRERLKDLLKQLDLDFLQKEFIYPAREIEHTDNYKKFIEPLYGKLLQQEMAQ